MLKKILFLITLSFLVVGFGFAQQPAIPIPDFGQASSPKAQNIVPITAPREIAPEARFLFPKNKEIISRTINLKIRVNGADKVSFFAKRQGDLLTKYLGKADLIGENQWVFLWDTHSSPNGIYIIFSEIINQYGSYNGQEIIVEVKNEAKPTENIEGKIQAFSQMKTQTMEINQEIIEIVKKTEEQVLVQAQELIEKTETKAPQIAQDIREQVQQIQQNIGQQTTVIAEGVRAEQEAKKLLAEGVDKKEEAKRKLEQTEKEIEKIKQIEVSVLAEEVASRVKKEKEEIAQKTTHELQKAEKKISEANKNVEQAQASMEASRQWLTGLSEEIKNNATEDPPMLSAVTEKLDEIKQSMELMEKRVYESARIETEIERKMLEDSDRDGLPDFLELEIGTDPFNPDTSGDGYLDGEVFALGLDPRVPITTVRGKLVFQDPRKAAPKREDEFFIERAEIKISEVTGKEVLRLEGRGLPNAFISIYIYSLPIIVTTRTDEYGRWVYELDRPPDSGRHEAYVVLNNINGEIVARSESFNFVKTGAGILQLIPEAWAHDGGQGTGAIYSPYETLRTNFLILTAAVIVLATVLSLLIIGFFTRKKEKII